MARYFNNDSAVPNVNVVVWGDGIVGCLGGRTRKPLIELL